MPGISRRDFLDGAGLAIAAGLAPLDLLAAQPAPYPPALAGLRGSTDASHADMHALAREGRSFDFGAFEADAPVDLAVVGAGLAGLTAAFEYKRRHPRARILILDNHDDFGGHARRCEFDVGGRAILGYGGSESMVSPRAKFAGALKRILAALAIHPDRFYDERVFHRTLYPGLGLSRGVFFDAAAFGRDALVAGDPMQLSFDEYAPANPNARSHAAFLDACPLTLEARDGLKRLFAGDWDFLAGQGKAQKLAALGKASYRDFLVETCRLPAQGADFFQNRSHDNFGLGIDAVAARDAMSGGFPGAKALGLEAELKDDEGGEPYIHHFPDGNASLARALVRALIDGVAPGRTMEDLVTARFDYGALDREGARVRLRLNATALRVANEAGGVGVHYMRAGSLRKVRAARCVVAAFGSVMGVICPEMGEAQSAVLRDNVRTPLLYTKVVLRDWTSFARLGVHKISAPTSFSSTVKLDYPVSLGAYKFPRDPKGPIGLQLVHVPLEPGQGFDARTQARIGRQRLLETPFDEIEAQIRSDLSRMLGGGGFDAGRDVAAITVNRWSHGYSYTSNSLFDDVAGHAGKKTIASARIGNIVFASSDTGFDAYAHVAMGEAVRAARELG